MKAFVPELVTMPDRKVLTVTTVGDPSMVGDEAFSRLYGTAYATKFKVYKPVGKQVTFGKLCALWPDAHLKPKDQWTGIWAVPVPDYVQESDLIQKDASRPVRLELWDGGKYAQILHLGKYTEEEPTIKKLHEYIENVEGIPMASVPGTHEEEYLTKPDSKVVKTIIRYRLGV